MISARDEDVFFLIWKISILRFEELDSIAIFLLEGRFFLSVFLFIEMNSYSSISSAAPSLFDTIKKAKYALHIFEYITL